MEARPLLIGGKPATKEDLKKRSVSGRVEIGKERQIQDGELAIQMTGELNRRFRNTLGAGGIQIITSEGKNMRPSGFNLGSYPETGDLRILRSPISDDYE